MKTAVVCSGGLDSVSLAHILAAERSLSRIISFDYGQRHRKELEFARRAAERLAVILEQDPAVRLWMKPGPNQFRIYDSEGRNRPV